MSLWPMGHQSKEEKTNTNTKKRRMEWSGGLRFNFLFFHFLRLKFI